MTIYYVFVGPMRSGKTRELLNNVKIGDEILVPDIFKNRPDLSTGVLRSRDTTIRGKKFLFFNPSNVTVSFFSNVKGAIHIDEANQLTADEANNIISISRQLKNDFYFYGLEFDYLGRLFPGMEIFLGNAQYIHRLKTKQCYTFACQNDPEYDYLVGGERIGEVMSSEDFINGKYHSMCKQCHQKAIVFGI